MDSVIKDEAEKANPRDERFISREELQVRWDVSMGTILKLEKEGVLKPIRLISNGTLRYALSGIMALEEQARQRAAAVPRNPSMAQAQA